MQPLFKASFGDLLVAGGARFRVQVTRVLMRIGFGEGSFLVLLAFLIGVVTAVAAVMFHGLIQVIRHTLYGSVSPEFLYGRGVWMLVLLPALGGLAVAVFSRFIAREREGHGIVDVMESVLRTSGFIRASSALEKILTSAMTIGSGGSAGAEGPIVQIGAAIASGVGKLFRIGRQHMPILIGCGSAAGISAIFDSPIGGLLFTMEVILRDFSIRTLTPLVIASVIANFATAALFHRVLHENYTAIFNVPAEMQAGGASSAMSGFDLAHSGHFIALGLLCGVVGVTLTRMMHFAEKRFAALRFPRFLKPALGGAMLGLLGLLYVLVIGHWELGRQKFIPFEQYEMPAFFGDGYGAVRPMLGSAFYTQLPWLALLSIILFLCVAKIAGTCLTLGSGGAGGIIAPSLFLGAVTGGGVGIVLERLGIAHGFSPPACALIAMGAVLAAVVHAPLAAMMILFDVTHRYEVVLPGMLTTIVATAAAQLISRDSIYTASLRLRGIRVGSGADLSLLRRLSVEQVQLEPAVVVRMHDPLQRVLDLVEANGGSGGTADFIVYDVRGVYIGMLMGEDIKTALFQREAIPLLTVSELMRTDVPLISYADDLASVLDLFSARDVARLPVCVSKDTARVIGLISRASLMRRYQAALSET